METEAQGRIEAVKKQAGLEAEEKLKHWSEEEPLEAHPADLSEEEAKKKEEERAKIA